VNITEIYGIEDDVILTQDIFAFEQTGVVDGKVQGDLKPTGIRPTFMPRFAAAGVELPPDEFGIPPEDPAKPVRAHPSKSRFAGGDDAPPIDTSNPALGAGTAVHAGGMVYVSSIGPVDPETGQLIRGGIREQTRQCVRNLQAVLEAAGTSMDRIVWANWSLKEPTEFEVFNEEWIRSFPAVAPVGQGTLMPPLQRRAGFRISIGVIAQAG
jgi:2-iminobutanoate/2-iminopropanoate deaminase